jgi:L,D-transpeptidase catalytic domain
MKKITITIPGIISLLFITTMLFYSSIALSARHKKHSHAHSHHAHLHKLKKVVEADHQFDVDPHVWELAFKAYNKAIQKGYIRQKVLTIIDYSLPSSAKRMWVVDVKRRKVLYHTLVTHGRQTGGLFARHFSDRPGSQASSIGTFITESTYMGSNGYSLRLRGLEPGFNDKARSRAIVMHGAWYATQDFAKHHGRLGLSFGCPAVSPQLARPIINEIKNGSMVFAYYPDSRWLQHSRFL